MFKYDDKFISKLIEDIYNGKITTHELPASLYHAIAENLKAAVYKGFGSNLSTVKGESDTALLEDLRSNIYMFSAAKTYQQVKEMTEAIADSDGTVKPFNEFKKDADKIFDTYNKDYLKTEYDTAVGQSLMASKWQTIQEQKEVLPYLAYSTIGDACDICAPLDGLTAPVSDPIWDTIIPLNHFNCECIVEQLDEDEGKEKLTPEDDKQETFEVVNAAMSDVFKMNPGKDGYVFSPDHPYFTVPKDDKDFARENFGLPIPPKDEDE